MLDRLEEQLSENDKIILGALADAFTRSGKKLIAKFERLEKQMDETHEMIKKHSRERLILAGLPKHKSDPSIHEK